MRRLYFRSRILLMTFALGLSSFWFFDGMKNGLVEIPVELPKVESDKIIVVFPRYEREMPHGGGGAGGKNHVAYKVRHKTVSQK